MQAQSKMFKHLVEYTVAERLKDMDAMDKAWEQVLLNGTRWTDFTLLLRTPGGTISANLEEELAEDPFAKDVFRQMMDAKQIVIAKAEWPKCLGSYLYFGSMFVNGKLLDMFFFNMCPEEQEHYTVVAMYFDEQFAVNGLLDHIRGEGKV